MPSPELNCSGLCRRPPRFCRASNGLSESERRESRPRTLNYLTLPCNPLLAQDVSMVQSSATSKDEGHEFKDKGTLEISMDAEFLLESEGRTRGNHLRIIGIVVAAWLVG